MAFLVGVIVDSELAKLQKEIFEIQSDVRDEEKTLLHVRKLLAVLEKAKN